MSVEVRQAHESDRPAIAEFIREAYAERASYKDERRWSWQFARNPFSTQKPGLLPIWVAADADRIVGQIAVQEALLQIGDRQEPAGWIVDVMVLPGYRGLGLGNRLYEQVARDVATLVTLTMAPATRRMAANVGSITLGQVSQYTRLVRLDPDAVRRYLLVRTIHHPAAHRLARLACRTLRVHRVLPSVVNAGLRLRDRGERWRTRLPATEIEETAGFGEEADRLWERLRHEYPVIFSRESRFLNWRFADCPDLHYRLFTARRGGNLVGYLVLRRTEEVELPQGVIVDLLAARGDTQTFDDLVRFGIEFFGRKVAAVDCATSVPELHKSLRRHGFHRTHRADPTCVCSSEELRSVLSERRNDWFFSKADHDWDQIHVA